VKEMKDFVKHSILRKIEYSDLNNYSAETQPNRHVAIEEIWEYGF
jgi:hypothetical protein